MLPHDVLGGVALANILTLISIGKDGVVLVAAGGDITTAEVSSERNPFESLLGANWFANRVVLDLGKTGYVDSSGIGWLIATNKQFKANGGALAVCSIGMRVRQLLDMLKVSKVVTMVPDEAAARQFITGSENR